MKNKLKLEAGKRYVRRDGKITGVLQKCPEGVFFEFIDPDYGFNYDEYGGSCYEPLDIMEEYIEETPEKESKYAVQATGFGAQPFTRIHDTYEIALAEAQRLAEGDSIKKFWVVEILAEVGSKVEVETKEYVSTLI